MEEKYFICLVTRGTNIAKKRIMTAQIIKMVISAPIALGRAHFLILIPQIRSTSGRPIIDSTPDTRM
jgi:hypothetical protein